MRLIVVAIGLAACGSPPLVVTPHTIQGKGSPHRIYIDVHCGYDPKAYTMEGPAGPVEMETPAAQACPEHDGNVSYIVDLALRTAGFEVVTRKWLAEHEDALPANDRGDKLDARHLTFDRMSAGERARMHESLGIDGVVELDIHNRLRDFARLDISAYVGVRMLNIDDLSVAWAVLCEARAGIKPLAEGVTALVDDAARCAIGRIPGVLAR